MKIFTALVGIYMFIELIVGIVGNSIALQTDAFHMLSDFIALIIASSADHYSKKGSSNKRYSYGLKRAETIGAFFNSSFLAINLFWLARENIESFIRLSKDPVNEILENNIIEVLITASIGLLLNILGITLFHEHSHSHDHNHNHKALVLHLLTDLLGSIVVIISSLTIKFTDFQYRYFLDPLGSSLIVILLFPMTIKQLLISFRTLMQKSPIDIENLTRDISSIEGVEDLHELHVWSVDSKINIASMHVKTVKKGVITQIKDILHEYNIHSSSIQRERGECPEPNCRTDCQNRKCCNE